MKKSNRINKNRIIAGFLCFTFAMGSLFSAKSISNAEGYWPSDIDVTAEAAIVMEYETGTILYEKNMNEKHYPASITKILTGVLAVENSEMDEVVTFSKECIAKNETNGASHIARDVGEQMTIEQCLYGTMVASANECAWAVAEHISGDVETFVGLMNDKVKELGCKNTHFTNPNGLHSTEHYTSAYDMALIARYAYSNDKFRSIFGTKRYTIPPTNKHKEETYLSNHHLLLNNYKTGKYLYQYAVAGKTGYTTEADNTLVSIARKDGVTLICVIMKCPGGYKQYEDTRALFDFAFDNFSVYNISENFSMKSDASGSVGKLAETIDLIKIDEKGIVIIPKTASFSELKSEIISESDETEQSIGEVRFTFNGKNVGSAKIFFASSDLSAYPFDNLKSVPDENVEYYYPVLWPFFAGLGGILLIVAIVLFVRSKAIDIRVFRYRNIIQKRKPRTNLARIKRRNRRFGQ